MSKEQELLLKDLCCRLPYGVKGVNKAGIVTDPSDWYCGFVRLSKELENRICFSGWRPYLLPMSSMTEEQREEYSNLLDEILDEFGHPAHFDTIESIDWLYEHHFDHRGLIPLGLAIDCTNLNIY